MLVRLISHSSAASTTRGMRGKAATTAGRTALPRARTMRMPASSASACRRASRQEMPGAARQRQHPDGHERVHHRGVRVEPALHVVVDDAGDARGREEQGELGVAHGGARTDRSGTDDGYLHADNLRRDARHAHAHGRKPGLHQRKPTAPTRRRAARARVVAIPGELAAWRGRAGPIMRHSQRGRSGAPNQRAPDGLPCAPQPGADTRPRPCQARA